MPKVLTPRNAALNAALYTYLTPRLAMDAQVDLSPVALQLRRGKPLIEQKDAIIKAVDGVVKDKLAKDENIDDIAALLDAVSNIVEGGGGEAPSIPEGMSEEDQDDLELQDVDNDGRKELVRDEDADPMIAKIREFLKSLGTLSDDDLAKFDQLVSTSAEPEDVNPKLEENPDDDDVTRDNRMARDTRRFGGGMRRPAGRHAMDEAEVKRISDAAVEAAVLKERQNQRSIHAARTEVRPVVGELSMSFDSAEDIYAAALRGMGYADKIKGMPREGYRALFQVAADSKRNTAGHGRPTMAHDASGGAGAGNVKPFSEMYPTSKHITVGS